MHAVFHAFRRPLLPVLLPSLRVSSLLSPLRAAAMSTSASATAGAGAGAGAGAEATSGAALKAIVAPSMLSSDFANLAAEAERISKCGADWLHMDVMDGHFVPNLTIGPCVVKALRKHTTAFLDCHCMVTNPGDWIDAFAAAGASQMTFHVETQDEEETRKLIARVQEQGMRCGLAVSPDTPVDAVMPFVDSVSMVLIMTVRPGFGGQSFMPECLPKVEALRAKKPTLDIQVDGGLKASTVDAAAKAGANVIVAGTYVFKSEDPAKAISTLRTAVQTVLDA